MSNLKLDYSALNTETNNLKNVKSDLDEVFDYIEQNTEMLRDYWESKTSREVFESFESFYNYVTGLRTDLQTDINFLQGKVYAAYTGANTTIDTQVEDKM